ncbi:MAG: MBL fold metallo-hydrolase [Pseudomonadota bacterium]
MIRVHILGCGSSGGVPRPGGPDGAGDWGACDPTNPKNRRTRCSILVQKFAGSDISNPAAATTVLIDTSPDMRSQLLNAKATHIDAVLYTHDHADQAHGIDDLRIFAISQRRQIATYIDKGTAGELTRRFSYCFEQAPGSIYPAILKRIEMPACGEWFTVDGPGGEIPIVAFLQDHGPVNSLGFRIGNVAYSSDVVGLPEESFALLSGVDTWIVDALQYKAHGTHAHLDLALEWIKRVAPRRAILTNMHVHMDYEEVKKRVPPGVEPAYDGMVLDRFD